MHRKKNQNLCRVYRSKTTEKPLKMTKKYRQKPNRKNTEPQKSKTREKDHREPPPKPLLILAERGKREKEKKKAESVEQQRFDTKKQ